MNWGLPSPITCNLACDWVAVRVDANCDDVEIIIAEVLQDGSVVSNSSTAILPKFNLNTATVDAINSYFEGLQYPISIYIAENQTEAYRELIFVNNSETTSYHLIIRGSKKVGWLPKNVVEGEAIDPNNASFVHGLYGFTDDIQPINYHPIIYGCLTPMKPIVIDGASTTTYSWVNQQPVYFHYIDSNMMISPATHKYGILTYSIDGQVFRNAIEMSILDPSSSNAVIMGLLSHLNTNQPLLKDRLNFYIDTQTNNATLTNSGTGGKPNTAPAKLTILQSVNLEVGQCDLSGFIGSVKDFYCFINKE